jgi:two-component sensor histidine kinase
VAALLRLQSRRLDEPKARAALDEAVRRVGSIATVHETLSHAAEEIVNFDDVAERVAAMAGEVSAAEARVKPVLVGRFGLLPSAVATPLALVLAELLQNALQHGLAQSGSARGPDAGLEGLLEVRVDRTQDRLTVIVQDNGVGLPEEFDLASATSLGLQIVRTLVVSELGGRLEVKPRAGGGTKAVVDLPMDAGAPLSAQAAPIRP